MKVFILTGKRIAALAAAAVLITGVTAAAYKRSDTAVAVNTEARSVPIYYVGTEEKKVSLSFDAAWGDEYTQPLLDILNEKNVKSTFFLVGDWVRKYPNDVKKIFKAGHDIGNHSDTHPYMTQLDIEGIKSEITTCSGEIEKLTGVSPTLFRPPYGDYDNNVVNTVKGLDMYCVQWSIDSLDWQDPSPDEILTRVKDNLHPGAIILMHNGAKNTPEALPKVIDYIKSQGYTIVPISQLLPKGSYTTDPNGMMTASGSEAIKTAASPAERTAAQNGTSDAPKAQDQSSTSSVPMSSASKQGTSSKMTAQSGKTKEGSASSSYSGTAGEVYDKTVGRSDKKM